MHRSRHEASDLPARGFLLRPLQRSRGQHRRGSRPVEQVRLIDRAATATAGGLRNLRGLKREPLDTFLTDINRLEKEGDTLYRRATAELYLFTGEIPRGIC
jgi:hypothetical protein